MTWRLLEPRPSNLWLRLAPRAWRAAERPYLDLPSRSIVWPAPARAASALPPLPSSEHVHDVCLLPPLEPRGAADKEALARALVAGGGFVLDHRFSAQEAPPSPGVQLVSDLLAALLAGELDAGATVAAHAVALVPLLPVVSSGEATWLPVLEGLRTRSPRAVLGVAPALSPADRRELVGRLGEEKFEAIHHAERDPAGIERDFARAVASAGLEPFFDRPFPPMPPRAARNREIATALALAGELWLALGRSEGEGVAMLAAARHGEATPRDLAALAREGQLGLLRVFSPLARRLVEELAERGRSSLLEELRAGYLGASETR